MSRISYVVPRSTIFDSIVNLLKTLLGTGLLALPLATSTLGVVPGVLLLAFSGILAAISLDLLVQCCWQTWQALEQEEGLLEESNEEREETDEQVPLTRSSDTRPLITFALLSKRVYPKLVPIFDLAIVIKCLGVAVSYLMVAADSMQTFHPIVFPTLKIQAEKGHALWVLICALIISPVCFFKQMRGLKWSSMIGILAGVYLTLVVFIHHLVHKGDPAYNPPDSTDPNDMVRGPWSWFHVQSSFMARFPVFVFAFTCHQNMPAIYSELIDNTRPRNDWVILASIGSAGLLYLLMALCGYLQWGSLIEPNVINNYDNLSAFPYVVARLVIAFYGLSSYPLQLHPVRTSMANLLPDSVQPKSTRTHVIMTLFILISTTIVACLVTSLDVVLGIIGATGSTTLCYLLPGLLFYGMMKDQPETSRIELAFSLFLIGFGVIVMVSALTMTILGAAGH